MATSNGYGLVHYCRQFEEGCRYGMGDDESGLPFRKFPKDSRYIKSEDILYEIKKIQQAQVLSDGMKYAQEKYSNGETTMQILEERKRLENYFVVERSDTIYGICRSNKTE